MNRDSSSSKKEALIKQLRLSSLPVQREKAAILLANFPESDVLDALLNAQLHDPNPKVRDAASQSLATLISYSEEDEEEIEKIENQGKGKESGKKEECKIFNLSKEVEVIRKGATKFKFSKGDSIEITQLFNKINSDRYLKKQMNVKGLINSLLLLPIEDKDLGRDVAIAITEILRRTFDETERMTAISCLSNIITNIDRYNPMFGIAEAYLMIFKTSDDSDMRITAFKCIEEIIVKKKSLSKLSKYVNDVVKLLTFSYDRKIREIAIFAYPDLVLLLDDDSRYLVDQIIRIVRATYEDQLREMGLKALETLILRKRLIEENFESIVKILKSHHTKNIRLRGIELFIMITLQAGEERIDDALAVLFNTLLRTKDEDICYAALQNIEHYSLKEIPTENTQTIYKLIELIATKSPHPLLALRAYNLVEKLILEKPEKITSNFVMELVECLRIHTDLGVTEQALVAFCELTYIKDKVPELYDIKNLLYLSDDSDVLEGLISIYEELLKADKNISPKSILNKLMKIASTSTGKHEIFQRLADLDLKDFKEE
ncbi:MAG: HEAT repeat domain-containing protein [Candidatus Heimdallarchaeaceae archaeon]